MILVLSRLKICKIPVNFAEFVQRANGFPVKMKLAMFSSARDIIAWERSLCEKRSLTLWKRSYFCFDDSSLILVKLDLGQVFMTSKTNNSEGVV